MATTSAPYNSGGMVVVTHVYPQQGGQGDGLPQTGAAPAPSSRLQKFLKGEPSILGTVQIMTGIVILLFGIVGTFDMMPSTYTGISYWGALMYITAGSLTIRADKTRSSCMVKASLGMNVVSFVAAALAIIIYSFELILPFPYENNNNGNPYSIRVKGSVGVMLVLSVLQFIVSIYLFAFACRATCSHETQPIVCIDNQYPASLLTVAPSSAPLNTSEMAPLPSCVPTATHSAIGEDSSTGEAGILPPKYTPTP
ncbi:membrane-spanning 4-domains subfamily A member 4A-like isoform X5 [Engraulis encrasicolus]